MKRCLAAASQTPGGNLLPLVLNSSHGLVLQMDQAQGWTVPRSILSDFRHSAMDGRCSANSAFFSWSSSQGVVRCDGRQAGPAQRAVASCLASAATTALNGSP
jgi:hypothetical protein